MLHNTHHEHLVMAFFFFKKKRKENSEGSGPKNPGTKSEGSDPRTRGDEREVQGESVDIRQAPVLRDRDKGPTRSAPKWNARKRTAQSFFPEMREKRMTCAKDAEDGDSSCHAKLVCVLAARDELSSMD